MQGPTCVFLLFVVHVLGKGFSLGGCDPANARGGHALCRYYIYAVKITACLGSLGDPGGPAFTQAQ